MGITPFPAKAFHASRSVSASRSGNRRRNCWRRSPSTSKPRNSSLHSARKALISGSVKQCSWRWNSKSRHSLVLKKSRHSDAIFDAIALPVPIRSCRKRRMSSAVRRSRARQCRRWAGDDVASRKLLSKAHPHDSTRPQVREAAYASRRADPRDGAILRPASIRSKVRPIEPNCGISACAYCRRLKPGARDFSLGIAQASQAEIDREHIHTDELLRGFDRVLTGPAAGDQDLNSLHLADVAEARPWKLAMQVHVDGRRSDQGSRPDPSRIWIFLVLLLHQQGHVIRDGGQARD